MAASTDPTQVSPKVRAIDKFGGLILIVVAALAFIASGVTPDLFPALGPWAPLISGAIVLVGVRAAAWSASDPLRENTALTEQARQFKSEPDGNGPAPDYTIDGL